MAVCTGQLSMFNLSCLFQTVLEGYIWYILIYLSDLMRLETLTNIFDLQRKAGKASASLAEQPWTEPSVVSLPRKPGISQMQYVASCWFNLLFSVLLSDKNCLWAYEQKWQNKAPTTVVFLQPHVLILMIILGKSCENHMFLGYRATSFQEAFQSRFQRHPVSAKRTTIRRRFELFWRPKGRRDIDWQHAKLFLHPTTDIGNITVSI